VHLAPGDIHADVVDLTELIGRISLGVKSKSIVESDVLKWLGHRVETKALTYLGVVRVTLLRRKCGEIALDNDSFQHFCRLLGGHGQPRAVARHHSLTSTSTFTLNTSRSGSSTVTPGTISPVSASTTGAPGWLPAGWSRFLISAQSGVSFTRTRPICRA